MWEIGRVNKVMITSVSAFIMLISLLMVPSMAGEGTRDISSTLGGRIVHPLGDPVSNVVVVAYSSQDGYLNSTLTNQTGNFTLKLPPLPPGTQITILIQKDDHFTRTFNKHIFGLNIDLGEKLIFPIPAETEDVSGRISNPVGIPVKDAEVKLVYNGLEGSHEYVETTDVSGTFSFTVFPDTFEMQVMVKGILVRNETVEIGSGEGPYYFQIGIQTVPDRDSLVEGYINDQYGPISGATVGIVDRSSELGTYVSTNETGYFTTTFWGGDHVIIAMMAGYEAYVDVIPIPTTGKVMFNITLEEELFWLNGTVRDGEGVPVEDITVQYIRANSFISFNTDKTDISGDFSIKVPKGEGYLMAVEDSPFDQEDYDTYFHGPLNITDDVDRLVTMKEKEDITGTTVVDFRNWEDFNISTTMKLSLNSSKGARVFIDMMFGNSDLTVQQNEADMFVEMIIEEDPTFTEGTFSNDTRGNLTLGGNHYNLISNSIHSEFQNLTGNHYDDSPLELRQGSAYSMNGSIPEGTTDVEMRLNLTYREEKDDRIDVSIPVPDGWLYSNHGAIIHQVSHENGILSILPGEDPDTEDDTENEWITIDFVDDSFLGELPGEINTEEGREVRIVLNVTDHMPDNDRSYQWDLGDNTTVNTTHPEVTYSYPENGTYDVTVRMNDSLGRETHSFSIVVVGNRDPELNISVRGGINRTFLEGESIIIDVNASDMPEDPLMIRWGTMGNWNDYMDHDTDNSSFQVKIDDDGNFTVHVSVKDDDGGFALEEIRLKAENVAPTFLVETSGTGQGESVVQGETVTIRAFNLTDVDNDTVSFDWTFSGEGSIESTANDTILEIMFLDTGLENVSLRVFDEDGGVTWWNISLEIMEDIDFDHDGDGMPRWWEELKGLNDDLSSDAGNDPDRDGLTNLQEFQNGTDPDEIDTDSDGMPDDFEVEYGLKPLIDDADDDPDLDGISNIDEYNNGTDPSVNENSEEEDDDDNGTQIFFIILIITGIVVALGATILMVTRRKQSSMWYEE